MAEVESSIAPSQIADSVMPDSVMMSTIGGPAKSTRSIDKVKFMDLIDQAKGLLGDLQEHEEVRETRAAEFYNPNSTGDMIPPKTPMESDMGRIIGRKGSEYQYNA